MAQPKLTADQVRRIEEIEEFRHATDRLKRFVAELESNRAGQTRVIQQLSEKIAHESAQMRQRALTSNIGKNFSGGMVVAGVSRTIPAQLTTAVINPSLAPSATA